MAFGRSVARERPLPWLFLGISLLGALFASPGSMEGQSVHGRVFVKDDTTAVPGADLTLKDSTGTVVSRVQSNDRGEFRIPAPGPGSFRLGASRIGFSPFEAPVLIGERESVEVELRMAEEAIPLEPLVVVARRQIREGTLDEFYDRMARMKQKGKGQFLTKEQIEARVSMSLPMLLQTMPYVWLASGGRSIRLLSSSAMDGIFCSPEYILDGRPMLGGYREIQVLDLEGVEVYRGYSESIHGYYPNRCGMVFLWRRPDWGHPFSWDRVFLAGGLVAFALAISSLF